MEKVETANRAKKVEEFDWIETDVHIEKNQPNSSFKSTRLLGKARFIVLQYAVRTFLAGTVCVPLGNRLSIEKLSAHHIVAVHVGSGCSSNIRHPQARKRGFVWDRSRNDPDWKRAAVNIRVNNVCVAIFQTYVAPVAAPAEARVEETGAT